MKYYAVYEEYGKLDKRHQEFLIEHLEMWDNLYSDLNETIETIKNYSETVSEKVGKKVLSSKWNEQKNELDLYLGYSKMIKLLIKEVNVNEQKGKWLWQLADNGWADTTCSICGCTINDDIDTVIDWQYCPNCGTTMENGKKYDFKRIRGWG